MSDDHRHAPPAPQRRQGRLAIVLALAAGYMLAEAIGGLLTGSLALLADAGHMLTDVIALSLGLFAVRLAQRSPTPQRTYGYHRTEILVALAQGALLVGVALALLGRGRAAARRAARDPGRADARDRRRRARSST